MDESGFAIGDIEASQHIINATIRQSFKQNLGVRNGSQRWNAFVPMEIQFLR
jgi:hypothetical protein